MGGMAYLVIIILALLAGGAYWYFSSQEEEIAQTTPTPTRTATPTPTPTLSSIFGNATPVLIPVISGNPKDDFYVKLNAVALTGGTFQPLSITSETKGGGELSPLELMDRFLVSYPPEMKTSLGGETLILAYGQQESYDAKGTLKTGAPVQKRLVLISEVRDSAGLAAALTAWEKTMTDSLGGLLNFSKAKSASAAFLDNIYRGAGIRYKNFAYPDVSIDYSVVSASNGKSYLVITNSRESTYATVSRLKQ